MKTPKIIDLSTEISSDMISIPKKEHIKTRLDEISTLKKDNVKRTMLHCSCHCGTHMDAPSHMIPSKISIDKIDSNKFMGSAIKIKILAKSNQEIKLGDLKLPNKKYNFLILETGWYKHWGFNDYYTHYPYLSESLIKFICNLPIKGIIVDLPSLDKFGDNSFRNHKLIFKKNLIVVESAVNLNKLPENNLFQVYAFPLKLLNAEASPCRVIVNLGK